jgi:hypothetical protein
MLCDLPLDILTLILTFIPDLWAPLGVSQVCHPLATATNRRIRPVLAATLPTALAIGAAVLLRDAVLGQDEILEWEAREAARPECGCALVSRTCDECDGWRADFGHGPHYPRPQYPRRIRMRIRMRLRHGDGRGDGHGDGHGDGELDAI